MVLRSEFKNLVVRDASEVVSREDSDSIDIVDNVRYHMTSRVRTYSEIQSVHDQLSLIDQLLESLQLDCWTIVWVLANTSVCLFTSISITLFIHLCKWKFNYSLEFNYFCNFNSFNIRSNLKHTFYTLESIYRLLYM